MFVPRTPVKPIVTWKKENRIVFFPLQYYSSTPSPQQQPKGSLRECEGLSSSSFKIKKKKKREYLNFGFLNCDGSITSSFSSLELIETHVWWMFENLKIGLLKCWWDLLFLNSLFHSSWNFYLNFCEQIVNNLVYA